MSTTDSSAVRIHSVVPVTVDDLGRVAAGYREHSPPGVTVTVSALSDGPSSIETDWDVAYAVPEVVDHARTAEADGASAIVIDCFSDPGLYACREAVRIPVVGAAQSTFAIARTLTDRVAVLGTSRRDEPIVRDMWRRYGHGEVGVAVQWVDLPVAELLSDGSELLSRLCAAAVRAIDDGAGALVLGCTVMSVERRALQEHLAAAGHAQIPVLDPMPIALHTAALLARCGLTHSAATWPPAEPPRTRLRQPG